LRTTIIDVNCATSQEKPRFPMLGSEFSNSTGMHRGSVRADYLQQTGTPTMTPDTQSIGQADRGEWSQTRLGEQPHTCGGCGEERRLFGR
jgi:hypothetical protein